MDNDSYQIVSVYHKHVECEPNHDTWSRRNFHGLNLSYLNRFGLRNECDLIIDFQMWLNSFDVQLIYANDPRKERYYFRGIISMTYYYLFGENV